MPCGRPFHALSCGLLNAFVCICPCSEALTENRRQLRSAKGAGTGHERGEKSHMKTMLRNRNHNKKGGGKWEGERNSTQRVDQSARLPSSLARERASPGGGRGGSPGRAGEEQDLGQAAGRRQQLELRRERSPRVHLRFKGDSVTPVESSAVGPGGEEGWGREGDGGEGGWRGGRPWKPPAPEHLSDKRTHPLRQSSGCEGAGGHRRRSARLPPAASPGRRGAQRVRPVLNFTAH